MSGILSLPQGRIAPRRLDLAAFSSRPDAACHAGAVHAYLGVPFAQPPLGALRWRAPQGPSPSWEGVRQSSFAPDPAQLDGLGTAAWPHREGLRHSEDCLYLNVWVPQRVPHQGGKRPILFAIYGGSFVSGGASMAMHDGARLAHESNCIVVGCNYRLGVFGFLGSRALAAEAEGAGCGNYAMHDCIAALQWVQANAEHLGGDRENVTLFGQSAGSIMQHYLLISPATPAALFQRVILQSGVVTTVMPRTLPSAQATFEALLPEDGPDDDASRLAKLRAMDATQLLHAAAALPAARPRTEYEVNEAEGRPLDRAGSQDVRMAPSSLWGPVWDGVAVSKDFERLSKAVIPAAGEARKNGQGGIMLGYAIDEGTLFCPLIQTKEQLDAHIAGFNPTLQPALRKTYGADSVTDEVAWAVCSD
jgi:carboxylesterase type B